MSILSIERKPSEHPDASDNTGDLFLAKRKRLESFLEKRTAIPLELLVLMSTLMNVEHYAQLGPMLWSDLLEPSYPVSVPPVCADSSDQV